MVTALSAAPERLRPALVNETAEKYRQTNIYLLVRTVRSQEMSARTLAIDLRLTEGQFPFFRH